MHFHLLQDNRLPGPEMDTIIEQIQGILNA